jgi:membrane protein implicated in regulation of membrane protease activity
MTALIVIIKIIIILLIPLISLIIHRKVYGDFWEPSMFSCGIVPLYFLFVVPVLLFVLFAPSSSCSILIDRALAKFFSTELNVIRLLFTIIIIPFLLWFVLSNLKSKEKQNDQRNSRNEGENEEGSWGN